MVTSKQKNVNVATTTKGTLERKKKQGLPIGKPKGAKDTKPRRKRGYLENKNALSKKATKQIEEILLDPGE